MKKPYYALSFFFSLAILTSCSTDTEAPPCPPTENISMKINGEEREFVVQGRGIELNEDGSGHTLFLILVSGDYYPSQDTYSISMKLPYRKTGEKIIEEFKYLRVENGNSAQGYFVPGNLQSSVQVNNNTCVSIAFSGTALIDGNEITISEGIIDHTYADAF